MRAIINPSTISGVINAPPSKSLMQRVCAGALLNAGKTTIFNPGYSDDDQAAIRIMQQLGATIISQVENMIEINSKGINPIDNHINCSESGLSARLFAPIAALSHSKIVINGKGSLLQRPMDMYGKIFTALDVLVSDFNGYLPISVHGPLQPKSIKIEGSMSSQFLSGILFAQSFSAHEAIVIEVDNLKSKPYIDLTIQVLSIFGKHITHDNYQVFYIDPTVFETKKEVAITIESDWGSAAYWLAAGAMLGSIKVTGLEFDSKQADRTILNVLQDIGANLTATASEILIKAGKRAAFEFNATDCPDLFPILSILATGCEGESRIMGIHRLLHKESNRFESIKDMLTQFNAPFYSDNDTFYIKGVDKLQSCIINSYNDHRIVMAAAIGALRANGPVSINGAEAVNKSYPDFFRHLSSLGIDYSLINSQA